MRVGAEAFGDLRSGEADDRRNPRALQGIVRLPRFVCRPTGASFHRLLAPDRSGGHAVDRSEWQEGLPEGVDNESVADIRPAAP